MTHKGHHWGENCYLHFPRCVLYAVPVLIVHWAEYYAVQWCHFSVPLCWAESRRLCSYQGLVASRIDTLSCLQ